MPNSYLSSFGVRHLNNFEDLGFSALLRSFSCSVPAYAPLWDSSKREEHILMKKKMGFMPRLKMAKDLASFAVYDTFYAFYLIFHSMYMLLV